MTAILDWFDNKIDSHTKTASTGWAVTSDPAHATRKATEAAAHGRMADIATKFRHIASDYDSDDPTVPAALMMQTAEALLGLDLGTGMPHDRFIKAETLPLFSQFLRDLGAQLYRATTNPTTTGA